MNAWRRGLLVLHGNAAADPAVRAAVTALRAEGASLAVRVTWEPGDAERLAWEAAAAGVETVIAGGGDGTVNGVVNGLVAVEGHAPALAIAPLGTANDFARSAGVPADPVAALRLALTTEPYAVDVGVAGSRAFLNVATGGFGTRATTETSPELKRALGGAAYLVTGIASLAMLTPFETELRGPGVDWRGRLLVLAVGNGRQAGGGHVLCPEATLDDGLLDVRVLEAVTGENWTTALEALFTQGLPVGPAVPSWRVPWLEVRCEEPLTVNLDGEPVEGRAFRFELLPSRLACHLPEGSPLLTAVDLT